MDSFAEQVEHIFVENDIPRTRNRRVKVKMIALKYLEGGATPQELADHYSITLADVHAALTYYYDHQETFDAAERALEPLIEQGRRESEARLKKMQARMEAIKREKQLTDE